MAGHRPVGLPEPLQRVGDDLGDEGEEQADQQDEAGDDLEDTDRPFGRVVVLVQAGGVEHVQDRRPERLAEVVELGEREMGERGAAQQHHRHRRDQQSDPSRRRFGRSSQHAGRLTPVLDERWIRSLHVETLREEELHAGREPHVLFQASTIAALLEGAYDGDLSFAELAEHGDLGLGTLNGLDGEMIALDGRFYRADVDGAVAEVDGATRTPFAVVTDFTPSVDVEIEGRWSTTSCSPNSSS